MVRKELEWVMKNVMEDEKPKPLEDVQQFVMTAPGPDLGQKPQFSNLPQRKHLSLPLDLPSLYSHI